MSAANFGHLENARNYYVLTDETFELLGLAGIAGEIKNYFKKKDLNFVIDIKNLDNYRDYFKIGLGSIEKKFKYLGIEFYIYYTIYARAGYYTGANLDYNIKIMLDGYYEIDYIDDEIVDYMDDLNLNFGLWKIHKENLQRKYEKLNEEICEKIEEVFKEVCDDVLIKAAQFSNGETIYKSIK